MIATPLRTPTADEVKRLSQRNPVRFAVAYAGDWAMIALFFMGAAYVNHPVGYVLCVFLIGTRQQALAVLGHEGTHARVHCDRRINNLTTNLLSFWPLGLDGQMYRRFHLLHHWHTGEALDPELTAKAQQAPKYDLPLTRRRIATAFLMDLLGDGLGEIVQFFRLMPPSSIGELLGPLAWWGGVLGLLYRLDALWIAAVWGIALATSYWAAFRVRILSEHLGIAGTHRTSQSWWQKFLFFPHNIGYHYEHHKWPSIPFWNLPKVRLLDTSAPVIPVWTVFGSYASYPPVISGEVLSPVADESPQAA